MAADFFGQYLVTHGVITMEQLIRAITFQKSHNRLIGDIAVEKGMLTPEQVQRTNDEQRQHDMYFGDAAVSLGFVTKEQVESLLAIQKQGRIFLGDAVVRLGLARQDVVDECLQAFKGTQPPPPTTGERIIFSDLPNRTEFDVFVEMTHKALTRLWGMPSRMGAQNLVKHGREVPLFKWSAGVEVGEPLNGSFVVAAPDRIIESALQRGESATGQVAPAEPTSQDAVIKEMANVVCRLVAERLESRNIRPRFSEAEKQPRLLQLQKYRALIVEFLTTAGAMHVVLVFP